MTTPQLGRTASLVAGLRTIILATVGGTVVNGNPADGTDNLVAVVPYSVDSDVWLGDGIDAVQVLIRGAVGGGNLAVWNKQDDIFDALTAIADTIIGGVPVSVCWRQMSTPLGADAHGRPEVRDTYYLATGRTPAA